MHKTIEYTIPRVKPKLNYGLLLLRWANIGSIIVASWLLQISFTLENAAILLYWNLYVFWGINLLFLPTEALPVPLSKYLQRVRFINMEYCVTLSWTNGPNLQQRICTIEFMIMDPLVPSYVEVADLREWCHGLLNTQVRCQLGDNTIWGWGIILQSKSCNLSFSLCGWRCPGPQSVNVSRRKSRSVANLKLWLTSGLFRFLLPRDQQKRGRGEKGRTGGGKKISPCQYFPQWSSH